MNREKAIKDLRKALNKGEESVLRENFNPKKHLKLLHKNIQSN